MGWVILGAFSTSDAALIGSRRVLLAGKHDNPTVSLNFASGNLAGCSSIAACITTTRTSQETCEAPGAVVTYAAANTPCSTGAGLAAFESGINIAIQSQTFTTSWVPTNTSVAALASGTAPDGIAAAYTLTDNNTNANHNLTITAAAITSGQQYLKLVYAKADSGCVAYAACSLIQLAGDSVNFKGYATFDLVNCVLVTGSAYVTNYGTTSLANGWCHVWYVELASASTTVVPLAIFMTNSPQVVRGPTYVGSNSLIQIWGAQAMKANGFRPYCPTTTIAVTCAADVHVPTGVLKTALEASALRIVAKTGGLGITQNYPGTVLGVGVVKTALGVTSGIQSKTDWGTGSLTTANQALQNGVNNFGLSADGTGRAIVLNGIKVVSDANQPSAISAERIGSLSDSSAFLDGYITSLAVWSSRIDTAILQATINPNAGPLLASYTGQVANHTDVPQSKGGAKQFQSRSRHKAIENITSLQVAVPNVYVSGTATSGVETGIGATASSTLSVEYPVGTCTAATFSGISPTTLADKSITFSDAVSVNIPAGAFFYVRWWYSSTVGIPVNITTTTPEDTINGEAFHFAASGITDQTVTCDAITNTSANTITRPIAIIGPTTMPTVCLVGDSRTWGFSDAFSDWNDDLGETQRSVGSRYATINLGVGGDEAQWFANNTNSALRQSLFPYCTNAVVGHGVNDVYVASRSSAQILANLATIWGMFAGKPVYQITIPHETTSSDNWATAGNQTAVANSSVLTTLNNAIRAGQAGLTGYFEIANQVETAQDSGLWLSNGTAKMCTVDGIHEAQFCYVKEKNSGAINPNVFQFLLRRDLDPASNDNQPLGLDRAA